MSDRVGIVYPTPDKAEEMRTRLFQLQKEHLGSALNLTKR